LQTLQGDLVIVRGQRAFFQKLFGLFGSFRRIAREHALVKYFGGRKRRPVPKHDVKKLQAFHMTPEHDKAHCERRREDKSYWTP
jgi:hypothetical protein